MSEPDDGLGTLTLDGEAYSAVCHLAETGSGLKRWDGTLVGDDDILWRAFGAAEVSFAWPDGGSFPLIVTDFSPGSGFARFRRMVSLGD